RIRPLGAIPPLALRAADLGQRLACIQPSEHVLEASLFRPRLFQSARQPRPAIVAALICGGIVLLTLPASGLVTLRDSSAGGDAEGGAKQQAGDEGADPHRDSPIRSSSSHPASRPRARSALCSSIVSI